MSGISVTMIIKVWCLVQCCKKADGARKKKNLLLGDFPKKTPQKHRLITRVGGGPRRRGRSNETFFFNCRLNKTVFVYCKKGARGDD
jgi:hypothetical protein